MKIVEVGGLKLYVMAEYKDEKYGRVWRVYRENEKSTYVVEGKLIEEQAIIDELVDQYGRPVSERDIFIER